MMVAFLSVSAQADSLKKHRGLCEIHYPSDATVEWDCPVIPPGTSLETLFGERWVDVARFNRLDRRHARPGLSIKVPRRIEDLTQFTPLPLVYPPGELDEKFILIDLSEQFLGAYEMVRYDLRCPSRQATATTKHRQENLDSLPPIDNINPISI
jgi:hypothetical protein